MKPELKKKRDCPHLDNLQNHIDMHGFTESLSQDLTSHIYEGEGCSLCRDFFESYGQFHDLLSLAGSGLDAHREHFKEKRPASFSLPIMKITATAALFIFTLTLGLQGIRIYERKQIIREETHLFVQEILDRSFPDPAGFTSQIPPGWFDEEYL